jgi:hypothetical protein
MAQVRDIFLFYCFTRFGYMDVYNLTSQVIVHGIDGEKWVVKCREKTKIIERIPCFPFPWKLLIDIRMIVIVR